MIKGVKRNTKTLSKESVLELISEYDIYRKFMPDKSWKLNQITNSPFHKDRTPSFLIGTKSGNVVHTDFARPQYRGDCFEFVKQLYGLNYNDVLLKIDRDFGLGIVHQNPEITYKEIVSEYTQPESIKRYCLIQVMVKPFTKDDLIYWNDYYQDINDLRDNNIYSIRSLYLNRVKFPLKDTELKFGYLYDGHWKIYFPKAKEKKNKWLSNVPLNTAYGLNNLSPDSNTLICKSLKDYLVCRKIYENVCHVQNESLAAFSEETVEYIKNNSAEVFYAGDSDSAGKSASYMITSAFGFRHINPPDRLLPECKDFADWARQEGLENVRHHLITKGVYENLHCQSA